MTTITPVRNPHKIIGLAGESHVRVLYNVRPGYSWQEIDNDDVSVKIDPAYKPDGKSVSVPAAIITAKGRFYDTIRIKCVDPKNEVGEIVAIDCEITDRVSPVQRPTRLLDNKDKPVFSF